MSLVLTCGITGLVFVGIESSRSGSDAAAVAALGACPAVTRALGAPVEEAPMSMGCGEAESGGGAGTGTWTLSIRGPLGTASAWYTAHYTANGPWIVDAATVTLSDGSVITAVPCATAESAEPEAPALDRPRGPRRGRR